MDKTLKNIKKLSPLVSIIIPTYNSELTISRCIKSVVNQTYQNIEIIIIDDFSKDKTLEKINKFNLENLTIIKNDRNLGPSASRNKGIIKSSGEYISILDSDDFIFPNKIETQVNFLNKNTEYSIIGSNVIINNGKQDILSYRKNSHREIINTILYYNPFCHSSVIFKKKDFLKTDMYKERIFFGEDHCLIVQLLKFGKGHNIQEFLVKKFEIRDFSISSKVGKFDYLILLFLNRSFIFDQLSISKFSFKYFKSILAIFIIFLVYIFKVDKEKIRKILK